MPDKRRNRKLDVLGRDFSGYATYQELRRAAFLTVAPQHSSNQVT